MTETKTVVTTEEVEMVECSSCGQEIEKDEAHYFVIRNEKCKEDFSGQTVGWACEYCVENDPIGFPDPGSKWEINTPFILNFVLWALLAVSLLIVIL